jgi:hypothetical protein
MLPEDFLLCLVCFQDCFTAPSFQRFLTLMAGWILCTSKHTITGVIRAAGVVGIREHGGYHRFFNTAAWTADEVGLALMKLIVAMFPNITRVKLTVDDTLARHTGKHIEGAAMHHDPLLSSANKPFFHFGHQWVVLAVVVPFPRWGKVFSLPVLVRLYRPEKLNRKLDRPHRKKTELADEMLQLVAESFPDRKFLAIGDNAYVNRSVIRPLPYNVDFLGRARMDAALNAPPKAKPRGRGRPPVRGRRLASPAWRAKHNRWKPIEACIYGKKRLVRVQVFDALSYRVGRERPLRFVLIRDWPGHKKDDVLVTTDLSMTAAQIIEAYCARWSLENYHPYCAPCHSLLCLGYRFGRQPAYFRRRTQCTQAAQFGFFGPNDPGSMRLIKQLPAVDPTATQPVIQGNSGHIQFPSKFGQEPFISTKTLLSRRNCLPDAFRQAVT